MKKIITLCTYKDQQKAGSARMKLEKAGVQSYLTTETIFGMPMMMGQQMQTYHLKIFQEDIVKATMAMNEISDQPALKTVKCPNCSSDVPKIQKGNQILNFIMGLLTAITGLYPFFHRNSYKCGNCGLEFGI